MTTMTVEYDCGHRYDVPVALRDDQSALAHAPLVDTVAGMVDATHDRDHPECAGSED